MDFGNFEHIHVEGNRLDVVLKVAERCNLACPYCYYFFQENKLYETASALISEATVDAVAKFLLQGSRELGIDHINIGLHGGEPMLLPKKRFVKMCSMFRSTLEPEISVSLNTQTNGTLIDDEWVDIFAENDIIVGVSFDGPPEVHDAQRPDHQGRGSYDDTLRGLNLLKTAEKEGRIQPTGILCVANPDIPGETVVRHFVEDLGVRKFDLLLPREGWDSDVWKPQEKWIAYFEDLFRYWVVENSKQPMRIYNFSHALTPLMSEVSAQLKDWMSANRHNIMTINADGLLGPDDNVMALDEKFCRKDYTVFNISMKNYFQTEFWQQFVDGINFTPEDCQNCEWLRVCRSGELFNRYSKADGFLNKTVFCETIKNINENLSSMLHAQDGAVDNMITILENTSGFEAVSMTLETDVLATVGE